MKHSKTICVANKVVELNSIRSICTYFDGLPKRKNGKIEVIVHYKDNDELSGSGKEVIDTILAQNKPISRIEFEYRSEDWHSHLTLSVKDQFSSSSHCGLHYWISSDDDVWFNATRAQMQDLMEAVPCTPHIFRFFNSFGWLVSIVALCCATLGALYFLLLLVRRIDFQVTETMIKIGIFCLCIALPFTFGAIRDFLAKTFPIIDFDLFKKREKYRTKIWKVFVGLITVIVIPILLDWFKK